MFWSFLDLMNDAALLDVNQGFSGGPLHILLVALFALGLVLLFWFDRYSASNAPRRTPNRAFGISYTVVLLVALGIGFHSLGEGVEIGSLISYSNSVNTSASLITAIGGLGSGIAYVLHKFLEGFVIGVFAVAVRIRSSRSLVAGLFAGIPTIIGLTLAIFITVDAAYFFAIGSAAIIYIESKLIPNFVRRGNTLLYVALWLLGFYLMYIAGLFHSYTTIF
jgi:zinc transporter ZupT